MDESHLDSRPQKRIEALTREVDDLKAALLESEERFRSLTDSAPVGIFLDNADGKAIFINRKCAEFIGVPAESALEFDWIPFLHPDDRERMVSAWQQAFTNSTEFREEYRWVHEDGTVIWTLGEVVPILGEDGKATMFIGTLTDITPRKQAEDAREKLEAQLMQAQKMESVGRLAGGVAHDFNNLLMCVLNYADLCRGAIDDDHEAHAWLNEITERAGRSETIVKQLLAFARKQKVNPEAIDLNAEIERALDMLQSLIGEHISISFSPSTEPAYIKMDPVQVDQIMINLCVNARHAIDASGEIDVSVAVVREESTPENAYSPGDVIAPYVSLSVADTGSGIPPDCLAHIFDPFYTTKKLGQGTGLGLASVYGIVEQNQGKVNVSSTVGKGTSFCLRFPYSGSTVTGSAGMAEVREGPVTRGSETILLVEDEIAIQKALAKLLERRGYTILSATCPEEALRVSSAFDGRIHALVSDVMMPGITGNDLARTLRAERPGLKVLLMSGYSLEALHQEGPLPAGSAFMSKPFGLDELARTLRNLLDAD